MAHDNEYHDGMVAMLELIWGAGYMAPGGPGSVSKMLKGLDTEGARLLDVGCGIGGPAMEMARVHGARVTGIDLEAPLIDRARTAAEAAGLDGVCTFDTVTPGPLPFADATFDIVTSAGAITQTPDTAGLVAEMHRVLKPGGWLSAYEWQRSDRPYSDDMRYWFKMEGLTYALQTMDGMRAMLAEAGFADIATEDATDWYRAEAQREYALMKGDLYPRMVEALGRAQADHFVENWRAMTVVIDNGEMRTGYVRGRKESS